MVMVVPAGRGSDASSESSKTENNGNGTRPAFVVGFPLTRVDSVNSARINWIPDKVDIPGRAKKTLFQYRVLLATLWEYRTSRSISVGGDLKLVAAGSDRRLSPLLVAA
eukprot:3385885-Rhodomonas_salina.5